MSVYQYENKNHADSYYAATMAKKYQQEFPPLTDTHEFDIVVIGGGFTGLSAALELGKMGHKVALVERRRLCWGASGRNGGHILVNYNRGMAHIEKQVGKTAAQYLFQFSLDSRELLYQRIREYQIDCDLKPGAVAVIDKKSHIEELKGTQEFMAKNYQYPLEYWEVDRVQEEIRSPIYLGGLFDAKNSHFHPLNYGLGLAKVAHSKYGVQIFEQSGVKKWHTVARKNGQTSGDLKTELIFSHGKISARKVIFACNAYIDKLVPYLHRRVMLIGSFINTTAPLKNFTNENSVVKNNYAVADWNNEVTYFRLSADNRLIFGGGESFLANAQSSQLRQRGQSIMHKVFPQLKNTKIDYSWGGHIASTLNRLPHIGQIKKNVYYAQGFAGHGVSLSGQVGSMLAQTVHASLAKTNTPDINPPSIWKTFRAFRHMPMPISDLFRRPALAAAMYYYRFIDKMGR